MKRVAVLALILLLIAGVAYAKDYEVAKKAGEFQVTVRMDKNPPVTGENNAVIIVKDAAGNTVTDAKVRVGYSMPAMPGMPPMSYKSDAALSGTEYRTNLNLSMAGPWNVIVKVARAGKTSSMKFTVDAR
ncbi:MAG: FixH family protein [Alphaproteobacteria bacterium]|uniref:FixH family protein n=1 Tax=Candidatus Nitrobium versatile TaxID=2884831 RepID=A0A953JE98_9BACT|nr:FixH family protein [Candidatus Nitrobium versatile]